MIFTQSSCTWQSSALDQAAHFSLETVGMLSADRPPSTAEDDHSINDCSDVEMMKMDDTGSKSLRNRERARKLYYDHIRKQRSAIQNMTKPLKLWLCRNKAHPYPTKSEKMHLSSQANMTMTQVNNWFANARRRLKNTVKYPDMAWDERIRLYNSHVSGNAELLSVHSQDELAREQNSHRQLEEHNEGEDMLSNGPIKYKNAILQRYLNDTIRYGGLSQHYPESSSPSGSHYIKHRQISGSCSAEDTTSEDCFSPDSTSENQQTVSWPDELGQLQAYLSGVTHQQKRTMSLVFSELSVKELSAVMALTHLASSKS